MLKRNNKNGTQSQRRCQCFVSKDVLKDSEHNRTESTSGKNNPYQVLSRVWQNLLNNFFTEHLPGHKSQQGYKKSTATHKEKQCLQDIDIKDSWKLYLQILYAHAWKHFLQIHLLCNCTKGTIFCLSHSNNNTYYSFL